MIDTSRVKYDDDVFCVAPWLNLDIRQDGEVKPCCVSEYTMGDIKEKSLPDIWNDEKIRKLRESFLSGTKPKSCEVCWVNEASNKSSLRQDLNGFLNPKDPQWCKPEYKDHIINDTNDDFTVKKPGFIHWDVKLTSKCNFKCRMCSETSSSSFELEQNGTISGRWDAEDKTFEEVLPYIPMVRHLYFSGGEPLIIDAHYKILDEVIRLGREKEVTLVYNSNFSNLIYKGRHVFDYWKQFKDVEVHISIEGTEKRGELIRKGFKWDRFLSNAQQFTDTFKDSGHRLYFDTTVQALNVFNVMDLHKELFNRGLMKDIDYCFLNFLQGPRCMSVWVLDRQTKRLAQQKIRDHIDNFLIPNKSKRSVDFYESLIKYLDLYQEQKLIPEFLDTMRYFDEKRNESTMEIFPEFQRIWDVIKVRKVPKHLKDKV